MTTTIFKVWMPGKDPGDWWWNRRKKWVVVELVDGPFWFWAIKNSELLSYEEAKYLLIHSRQAGETDDDGKLKPSDWFAMRPYKPDKDKLSDWGQTVSVEEMYEKYGRPDEEETNPYRNMDSNTRKEQ